jgi:hypothetical protein
MKFFVEFQLKPGNKKKAMGTFELRGPNRNPGVSLQGAWIGKNEEVIFVLVESTNETLLVNAANSWGQFGDYQITPVIDLEQYEPSLQRDYPASTIT